MAVHPATAAVWSELTPAPVRPVAAVLRAARKASAVAGDRVARKWLGTGRRYRLPPYDVPIQRVDQDAGVERQTPFAQARCHGGSAPRRHRSHRCGARTARYGTRDETHTATSGHRRRCAWPGPLPYSPGLRAAVTARVLHRHSIGRTDRATVCRPRRIALVGLRQVHRRGAAILLLLDLEADLLALAQASQAGLLHGTDMDEDILPTGSGAMKP